ncbi:DUF4097 family beta strand repeat protein [bacterium]|nr:DUF4097 family beta strand repeat protein [bacterium]
MKRTGLCMTLALCALISVNIPAHAQDEIQKRFPVEPGGQFILDTDIGPIKVHSTAESQVSVDVVIEKRRMTGSALEFFNKEFNLDFEHQGNTVRVICERKEGRSRRFWNSVSRKIHVEFRVTLPQRFNAQLRTSGGGISVSDLEGDVTARTSGGGLHFGNIRGKLSGKTSGGGITLEGGEGDVDVHTSGGGIDIGKVRGDVKARTSGGGIRVEEVMGNINASTSGGPVNVTLTQTPTADCRLTTSGGGITVRLTSDAAVHVDASTSGGNVTTDFPVLVKGKLNSRSLQADINGGGPLLYLRTSGGGISIRQIEDSRQ